MNEEMREMKNAEVRMQKAQNARFAPPSSAFCILTSSFATRYSPFLLRRAFTLIELMSVVVLLALAVTLVAVRMDLISDDARIRAAAETIATQLRLAAQEARLSGEPRLIEYAIEGELRIRKPILRGPSWDWDHGRAFELPGKVRIERVLHTDPSSDAYTLRIRGEGRYDAHGLLLTRGSIRSGLLLDRVYGGRRVPLNDEQGTSLEELQSIWEAQDAD